MISKSKKMIIFADCSVVPQRYENNSKRNYKSMKISKNILSVALVCLISGLSPRLAEAQDTPRPDSIQCVIVGFDVGTIFSSANASFATLPDGSTSRSATMSSLYKSPWLDFGINAFYKFKSNWLLSFDADLFFGYNSDNLKHRTERMSDIYTSEGLVIGTNGTDAVVTAFNRGLAFKGGFGRIIPVMPSVNPNSGILARVSAGWLQQQTIFQLNEVHAPQVDGDYALLYDHQRRGFVLTESLGFWYMSNYANLVNCYVAFELSQVWSRSTRDYIIDDYLNLRGPDNNNYFDLLYTLKFCWMFPLKGKTVREYYYF